MSTEVNMGRYVIVNRNGADKYYWTPGVTLPNNKLKPAYQISAVVPPHSHLRSRD